MAAAAAAAADPLDKYRRIAKLGSGSYGDVYKAVDKATGETVALKLLKYTDNMDGVPPDQLREISILKMLSESDPPSRQVVRLLDHFENTDRSGHTVRCLVFEYVDTDLLKYLNKHITSGSQISLKIIKLLMYQLCKGLAFLHGHWVMHRDLKPGNVLMDASTHSLKIADLGLSRPFSPPPGCYTPNMATMWYRAPEILLAAENYQLSIDIWSAGVIFAELLTNQAPFRGRDPISQLDCIFRVLGTPNEGVWPGVGKLLASKMPPVSAIYTPVDLRSLFPTLEPEGLDLLKKMLQYDPMRRISAKESLDHPYFNNVEKTSY